MSVQSEKKMRDLNIEKYRIIWLNQLLIEYEDICWSYGIELTPPIFEISETTKEVGSWHPSTRILRLSHHLIVESPWLVTLQVLKHEMAHQLCSELFCSGEKGHGKDFQKGCELLGVEPQFRRAQSSLPELQEELGKEMEYRLWGVNLLIKLKNCWPLLSRPMRMRPHWQCRRPMN